MVSNQDYMFTTTEPDYETINWEKLGIVLLRANSMVQDWQGTEPVAW